MANLVAYIDGGTRGNPGPSGIGVVIDGSTDGTIRIAKWIGHQDNNVAEYIALLEALQCALGLKATALHVFSDSEVVVRHAADTEPVQHRAQGPRGPPQDFRGLFHGHRGNQIQEALLLRLCPFAIRSFLIYAKLAQEA
jgi:ribonuclease HI